MATSPLLKNTNELQTDGIIEFSHEGGVANGTAIIGGMLTWEDDAYLSTWNCTGGLSLVTPSDWDDFILSGEDDPHNYTSWGMGLDGAGSYSSTNAPEGEWVVTAGLNCVDDVGELRSAGGQFGDVHENPPTVNLTNGTSVGDVSFTLLEHGGEVYDGPTFVCGNGDEIPFDWVNDGDEDCEDGSDEPQDFDGDGVVDNWFDCMDGTNISMEFVNDGVDDCPDGEDEGGDDMSLEELMEMIDADGDGYLTLQEILDFINEMEFGDGENMTQDEEDMFSEMFSDSDEDGDGLLNIDEFEMFDQMMDESDGSGHVFICGNGDEIPFDYVNDGEEDCSDGSDEQLYHESDTCWNTFNGEVYVVTDPDNAQEECESFNPIPVYDDDGNYLGEDCENGYTGASIDWDDGDCSATWFEAGDKLNWFDCYDGSQVWIEQVNDDISDCPDGEDEVGDDMSFEELMEMIDADEDGYLTLQEILDFIEEMDGSLSQDDEDVVSDVFMDSDEDADGLLTIDEFEMFTQIMDEMENGDGPTFVCGNGDEIPFDWVNDGDEDCEDGSDEPQDFDGDGVVDNWFDCMDGTNISMEFVNDGVDDCPDGEDEGGDVDDGSELYVEAYLTDNWDSSAGDYADPLFTIYYGFEDVDYVEFELRDQIANSMLMGLTIQASDFYMSGTGGEMVYHVSLEGVVLQEGCYTLTATVFADSSYYNKWVREDICIYEEDDGGNTEGDDDLFGSATVDIWFEQWDDSTMEFVFLHTMIIDDEDVIEEWLEMADVYFGNDDGETTQNEVDLLSEMMTEGDDEMGENMLLDGNPGLLVDSWMEIEGLSDGSTEVTMRMVNILGFETTPYASATTHTFTITDEGDSDEEDESGDDCEIEAIWIHNSETWSVTSVTDSASTMTFTYDEFNDAWFTGDCPDDSEEVTFALEKTSGGELPDDEIDWEEMDMNKLPMCAYAYAAVMADGSFETRAGIESAPESGDYEIGLMDGAEYMIYVVCMDPEGQDMTVTMTNSDLNLTSTYTSTGEAEASLLISVPAGYDGTYVFDVAWTDGHHTESGTLTVNGLGDGTGDGSDLVADGDGFLPGFTGVFAVMALLGAAVISPRRKD